MYNYGKIGGFYAFPVHEYQFGFLCCFIGVCDIKNYIKPYLLYDDLFHLNKSYILIMNDDKGARQSVLIVWLFFVLYSDAFFLRKGVVPMG